MNEIIGGGDRATFFEMLKLAEVAFANGAAVKGALGALGNALVAEMFGDDHSDKGEVSGELVFEGFVFCPGVDTVEDDAFLAGFDEVFNLGDGLANDPIFAFGGTNGLAEGTLALGGDFEAAFFHFFVNHAAEIDFGDAAAGEIVDGDGFAAAAHADDSDDFDIFGV